MGVEQSRRDDMESLGYVMLYFCRGSLPWQGLKAATAKQQYDSVVFKKMATPTEVLCHGLPNEFAIYLNYTRSLRFDDRPDYVYLRKIFRDLFVREGFQYDYVFDWTVEIPVLIPEECIGHCPLLEPFPDFSGGASTRPDSKEFSEGFEDVEFKDIANNDVERRSFFVFRDGWIRAVEVNRTATAERFSARVPRLRVEGWVGIVSVVWALLIAIWVVITDRVVAWGKGEEEERLTGRAETRRTLGEWVNILVSEIVLIVVGLAVLLLSATLILRSRDSSLAPPGERYYVDGDKYQVHLFCTGNETDKSGHKVPTVLFEAGERPFGLSLQAFADNAISNGTIARYCYADRPGFGWSENAPSPFSAGMAADVLSEALARAGETGPWVLASAGVGSVYSRVFSARHGKDVTGILLIDPLHEDLLYRLASPHRGLFLWLRGILSPLGIERISGAIFRGRSREDRVYGGSAYQGGKYIKAKLQESLVADSLTKNEVTFSKAIQQEDTPLAIVSSGTELRKDSVWEAKQRDLSHLTKKLVAWDIVNKAPHEVWGTLKGREAIERRLGELVKR
ncbi:hypothetical protein V490_01646 [Pseudogymnoascus sp. VKM F-3557]|nr:hypothetical protein V490_01646 [Pseudogymnoascus sp. VKM F-3557]